MFVCSFILSQKQWYCLSFVLNSNIGISMSFPDSSCQSYHTAKQQQLALCSLFEGILNFKTMTKDIIVISDMIFIEELFSRPKSLDSALERNL